MVFAKIKKGVGAAGGAVAGRWRNWRAGAPDRKARRQQRLANAGSFFKTAFVGLGAAIGRANQRRLARKQQKQQTKAQNKMVRAAQGGMNSNANPVMYILFILFAGVVAVIDAGLFYSPGGWGYYRIFVHIMLWILAAILFKDPDGGVLKGLFGWAFVTGMCALFSIKILNLITWLSAKGLSIFFGYSGVSKSIFVIFGMIAAFLFIPAWIHLSFIQTRQPKNTLINILEFLFYASMIIAVIMVLAKGGIFEDIKLQQELSPEAKAVTQQFKQEVEEGVPTLVERIRESISAMITGVIKQSVGEDIYNSRVDKNKEEPLGVYILNIQPSASQFYEGDEVVVWATLKARTLDSDNPIKIKLSCSADTGMTSQWMSVGDDPKKYRLKGDANPAVDKEDISFDIATFEMRDIDCVLPEGKLLHGLRPIYFNAYFSFPTMAYHKAYFMEEETLRAMRREGIDPLHQYGITDKIPVTVHSNGPVSIGMKTTSPLIGIKEESDFRLSLSFNNRWEGKIKRVNKIILKIPDSMELYGCDSNFKERPCKTNTSNECEEGKYKKVYELSSPPVSEQLKTYNQAKSYNCHVRIKDVNAVLGNVPIATHYFKATVEYDYELEKAVSVNIKDDPDIKIEGYSVSYFADNVALDYLKTDVGYKPKQSDEARVRNIISKWGTLIDEAHREFPKMPKAFIIGFMAMESGGDPTAISWAGAVGLIQLMPHTAYDAYQKVTGIKLSSCPFLDPQNQLSDNCNKPASWSGWSQYGTALTTAFPKSQRGSLASQDERFDPRMNILMSVAYLDGLRNRFTTGDQADWYKVAIGYNRGAGTVNKWVESGAFGRWAESGYRCGDPTCRKFGHTSVGKSKDILTVAAQNYGANVIAYTILADNILGGGSMSSLAKPFVEEKHKYRWPMLNNKLLSQCYTTTAGANGHAHKAIDIESAQGNDVIAIADGRVNAICGKKTENCYGKNCKLINGDECDAMGNYVEVRTESNLYYRVIHLKEEKVIKGQVVKAGDVIGLSGNTGDSEGPHLHIDVYTESGQKYATAFNPLCLYELTFLETLTMTDHKSCDPFRMELNKNIFNPNSDAFKSQCSKLPGDYVSSIWD